jgi:hypothetical protein
MHWAYASGTDCACSEGASEIKWCLAPPKVKVTSLYFSFKVTNPERLYDLKIMKIRWTENLTLGHLYRTQTWYFLFDFFAISKLTVSSTNELGFCQERCGDRWMSFRVDSVNAECHSARTQRAQGRTGQLCQVWERTLKSLVRSNTGQDQRETKRRRGYVVFV